MSRSGRRLFTDPAVLGQSGEPALFQHLHILFSVLYFLADFPSLFPICVRVSTPHVRHMQLCASLGTGTPLRLENDLPY